MCGRLWPQRFTLPTTKTINTSLLFQERWIALDQDATHTHGDIAFTTWLDIDQARQQAEAIKVALAELLPDHAEQIQTNFNTLATDLSQLDEQMMAIAKKIGNQPLIASHPVYLSTNSNLKRQRKTVKITVLRFN